MTTSADSETIREIRRLASDPSLVRPTRQATWDMVAQCLTKDDVCDKIIEWIDAGERVKPTTIHSIPGFIGTQAYEMKPRINTSLFYIKVALAELGGAGEHMVLFSVHPSN